MVLLTNSIDREIDTILNHSEGSRRRFYVYGRDAAADINYLRMALADFTFIPLQETRNPEHSAMFSGNSESDFFVLKKPRLSNIMDRDVEMYQIILKGRKLVVEDHPFMGKAQVFWLYFPYSFFDKSLLGYPHSYAFRDAHTTQAYDPYNIDELVSKVSDATILTTPTLWGARPTVTMVPMSANDCIAYAKLKDILFETHTTIRPIMKALRTFTMSLVRSNQDSLDILNPNRAWKQWQNGTKNILVTDAKVDAYLLAEFEAYYDRSERFITEMWRRQNG